MSESSKRGKTLELQVAAILRKKLGARVMRDKRSGAGTLKQDIRDFGGDIPFSIEVKDQATLKVKEWFRQAIAAASFHQVPTLVFCSDEEVLACVRFADLVNLEVEIRQLRAELADLRTPTTEPTMQAYESLKRQLVPDVLIEPTVRARIQRGASTDANGHITDDFGYCNQKGCKYSRGYRAPKAKKS